MTRRTMKSEYTHLWNVGWFYVSRQSSNGR